MPNGSYFIFALTVQRPTGPHSSLTTKSVTLCWYRNYHQVKIRLVCRSEYSLKQHIERGKHVHVAQSYFVLAELVVRRRKRPWPQQIQRKHGFECLWDIAINYGRPQLLIRIGANVWAPHNNLSSLSLPRWLTLYNEGYLGFW